MKTLQVSDETYDLIKDQLGETTINLPNMESFVGKKFFIRTVTYHLVGEITGMVGHFWTMKNASWVANSGRFMQAILNGLLDEVEPVGDALVNIQSVTDMFPWKHPLPTTQK